MPAVVGTTMTSTPTSQTAIMESSTAADKKRNKLGYHRTSVACVHCRRRKIRCLVAADDAQGRCENCIRLKKECQFFPVDQQPQIEKKARPGSNTASTDPSTASSSPPAVSGGEQTEAFFPYQPIPLSSAPDVAAFNAGAFAGNSMTSFAPDRNVGAPEFATAPPLDPSVPWDEFTTIPADGQMLANMSAGKPQMVNMPSNVWSPGPNPMATMPMAHGLPTPTVPSQPQTLSPAPTYAIQPDGSVWQVPPTRPMTYPPPPDMAAAPYHNPGQFQQPPPDMSSDMASPVHPFPGNHVNPQSPPPTDLQGTPVAVTYAGTPAAMGFPAWQDVNNMSPMNVVQYQMYAGDAAQQASFGSPPPMGHPGQRQSPR
ncbi:C6 finger domain protein [Aspergillus caelatus]|uniref:C6 finger domain protein n=1 Tax=Aspergillus caelatus TaxID=61420 RepID=A0A5N6ZMB5_9EURO|nr:C6 finger domain protein [Aspergillus caelatus]KAE8357320.1 C6 finger domain protein [Aspergillus caelatus]